MHDVTFNKKTALPNADADLRKDFFQMCMSIRGYKGWRSGHVVALTNFQRGYIEVTFQVVTGWLADCQRIVGGWLRYGCTWDVKM